MFTHLVISLSSIFKFQVRGFEKVVSFNWRFSFNIQRKQRFNKFQLIHFLLWEIPTYLYIIAVSSFRLVLPLFFYFANFFGFLAFLRLFSSFIRIVRSECTLFLHFNSGFSQWLSQMYFFVQLTYTHWFFHFKLA